MIDRFGWPGFRHIWIPAPRVLSLALDSLHNDCVLLFSWGLQSTCKDATKAEMEKSFKKGVHARKHTSMIHIAP